MSTWKRRCLVCKKDFIPAPRAEDKTLCWNCFCYSEKSIFKHVLHELRKRSVLDKQTKEGEK